MKSNYVKSLIAGLALFTMGAGQNIDKPLKFYGHVLDEMNSKSHYQKLSDKKYMERPNQYRFTAKRDRKNFLLSENEIGFSRQIGDELVGIMITDDPSTSYPIDQIRLGGDNKGDAFLVYDNEWKLSISGPFGPMTPVPVEQTTELKEFVRKAEESYKHGRDYAKENVGKIPKIGEVVNFHRREVP